MSKLKFSNGNIVAKVFVKQLNFKGLKDLLEFWKKNYKWVLLVKSIYSDKLNNIITDYHKIFHSIVKMKLNTLLTFNDSQHFLDVLDISLVAFFSRPNSKLHNTSATLQLVDVTNAPIHQVSFTLILNKW